MSASSNDIEHPVSIVPFLQTLVGTADEVWITLLKQDHRFKKHTLAEWRNVLNSYKK